jgi:protein-S-isoprenylcysteine O-methyltransferase Ste14
MPWILLTILGQIVGAVIIVFGIEQAGALSFLGIRQLAASEQNSGESEFINVGLYRWVRHPLYTGGLIVIWLAPSMTVNLFTLFLTLTVYLVVGARFEEERLIQEFGEVYMQYQKRVPMLVPLPRRKG